VPPQHHYATFCTPFGTRRADAACAYAFIPPHITGGHYHLVRLSLVDSERVRLPASHKPQQHSLLVVPCRLCNAADTAPTISCYYHLCCSWHLLCRITARRGALRWQTQRLSGVWHLRWRGCHRHAFLYLLRRVARGRRTRMNIRATGTDL